MTKNKRGECVYCGKIANLTHDHIPPKNLFAKPLPSNLITVPCCYTCNNKASKDDEYFRFVLTMREDVFEHPDATKNWDVIQRSLKRPKSKKFRESFLSTVQEVNSITKSGIYIGRKATYDVDFYILNNVVNRITKGLFYEKIGDSLDQDYEAVSFAFDSLTNIDYNISVKLIKNIIIPLWNVAPKTIGSDVFSYKCIFSTKDPQISIWLYIFYKKVHFFSVTRPLKHIELK